MGWNIVRHSFVLLFRNLTDALKVSVLPLAVGVVVVLGLSRALGVQPGLMPGAPEDMVGIAGQLLLLSAVTVAVYLFVLSMIAVAWHRFVLLEEYPGWVPSLSGRPIWPYAARVLLLGLLMVLIMFPIVLIAGAIIGPQASLIMQAVAGLGMGLIFTYIWLRLAIVLPATALGKSLGIRDAWQATGRYGSELFVAALILVALNVAVTFILGPIFGATFLRTVFDIVVTWITLMVGTSILTTLYGHLIEGRDLP